MNEAVIKAFSDATVRVLSTMAFVQARAGAPQAITADTFDQADVSGVIGVTGDIEGTMSISFSADSITYIVGSMFGETIDEVGPDVVDAVGELTNIICGDARRVLGDLGLKLEAAIPMVVQGVMHSVAHVARGERVVVPFQTDKGPFSVEVCMGG